MCTTKRRNVKLSKQVRAEGDEKTVPRKTKDATASHIQCQPVGWIGSAILKPSQADCQP